MANFLSSNSAPVAGTVVVIIFIGGVFTIANYVAKLDQERQERLAAEEREKKIEAAHAKMKRRVVLDQLNKEQHEIVKEGRQEIEDHVDSQFKLHWRVLRFIELLGGGSFGDCYHGTMDDGTTDVAIKKMRAGLVDKKGFAAFSKEVIILSSISHANIVSFVGL